jgi:hypothetical protein
VSSQLWVSTPGTLWVSEDEVVALASHLEGCETRINHIHQSVSSITSSRRDPFTQALMTMPAQDISPLVTALAQLAKEAQELSLVLGEYGRGTAEQERSRVNRWDVPRDRLFALVAMTLGGQRLKGNLLDADISDVAHSIVGNPGSHAVTITEVAHQEGETLRATSISDRVGRIPDGPASIRVERFPAASGGWDTDVYLAGTQEWSVGTSGEVFDMESNLALVAGISAASLVAVERAMKKAGVTKGDRVNFVGHSQGGLIAARLAESGRYATSSLLTVGAPLGTTSVKGGYPALAISHTDDLVPGLAGGEKPTHITKVETHSGASPFDVAGAHSKDAYFDTAQRVDASVARDSFPRWEDSGSVEPKLFTARRSGN